MIESPRYTPNMSTPSVPSVQILGLPVHNVDMETALTTIEGFLHARTPRHVVTADASMLVMAQQDPQLHDIICHADLVTPDSIGVLWAARRQGTPLKERVSGVVIAEKLCALSATQGYRIYFLGAGPGVAAQAAEKMRARYAGTQIVGTHDGYFSEAETGKVVDEISACQPDIVLVALGIPKQEKWIAAYGGRLGCSVLIGVGGTLDVLSGQVRRAPRLMQALRLEWLWRVLSNPRKINKVLLLPRFVHLVRQARRY